MAIIRTGPVVSDISGTLGSLVFVAGGRSTVVRPRPIHRTKTSPFLARQKISMQAARNTWPTLTTLQRDAWITRANDFNSTNRLGQSSPISGFELFIKVNLESRLTSASFILDPTQFPVSAAPLNVAAAFSAAGSFFVTADPPEPMLLGLYFVYGWPFWRDTPSRDAARVVFLASLSGTSLLINVRPQWETHFGTMTQNQHFAISVGWARILAFRSILVPLRSIVTA